MLRLEISGPCSAVTQTSPQNWLHPADRAAGGGVAEAVPAHRLLDYGSNAHGSPRSCLAINIAQSPLENQRALRGKMMEQPCKQGTALYR